LAVRAIVALPPLITTVCCRALARQNGFVREAKFVAHDMTRSHFGGSQRTASLGTQRERAEPTR
jgi:hypothetical protein